MVLLSRVPLTFALSGAALAAASFTLGALLNRRHGLLRLKLKLLARAKRTLVLSRVRVPRSLLPPSSSFVSDAEGLVDCDVHILDGKISAIDAGQTVGPKCDAGGSILLSCFTDAHTHMIKTHGHPRTRNPTGSINDALRVELIDQEANWLSEEDVYRRMDFAIATAYHYGTRAMRTHLDGTNSPDALLRATVYTAFTKLRAKWAAKGVCLQGVANLYLPLWGKPALAEPHLEEAMSHEGVLLGAYCGNVNGTPFAETEAHLDALFAYAHAHGVQVDLHIDETNDPQCCCLQPLVHCLRKARANGYTKPVLLGHLTALSLQTPAVQREVVAGLAALRPLTVIVHPATNLGLQDRRGSMPPHCVEIDADTPRTPQWRGLTLVQELAAAGVCVAAASDNVRDWWHPYGDYDGLQNWRMAITLGHLDTVPHEGAWAQLVSDAPALAMGLHPAPGADDGACATGGGEGAAPTSALSNVPASIAPGAAADLILFPDARRLSELLSRPQLDRIVLRRGRVQESTLPSYGELDDLVSAPSLVQPQGSGTVMMDLSVQRGATTGAK